MQHKPYYNRDNNLLNIQPSKSYKHPFKPQQSQLSYDQSQIKIWQILWIVYRNNKKIATQIGK